MQLARCTQVLITYTRILHRKPSRLGKTKIEREGRRRASRERDSFVGARIAGGSAVRHQELTYCDDVTRVPSSLDALKMSLNFFGAMAASSRQTSD